MVEPNYISEHFLYRGTQFTQVMLTREQGRGLASVRQCVAQHCISLSSLKVPAAAEGTSWSARAKPVFAAGNAKLKSSTNL